MAAPRYIPLSFWIHAHSPRGHGIHSPLLYSLCREVLLVLLRQKREKGIGERTKILQALLESWWTRNPTRSERNAEQDTLLVADTALLAKIAIGLQTEQKHDLPSLILVCQPRLDAQRWEAWSAAYNAMSKGVVIDLYTWGILLFVSDIASHKFAVRGFIHG